MSDITRQETDDLAGQVARSMFAEDNAAQALGIEIEKTAQGYARLSMTVRNDMINGHETCHGGMIFALADTAFAYACNSRNVATVAGGCSIEFIRPGKLGDRLTAEATEVAQGQRMGVYDVKISNQDKKLIAIFRGKSVGLGRPVIENPPHA
jgi:acyl-CoA thioesterase